MVHVVPPVLVVVSVLCSTVLATTVVAAEGNTEASKDATVDGTPLLRCLHDAVAFQQRNSTGGLRVYASLVPHHPSNDALDRALPQHAKDVTRNGVPDAREEEKEGEKYPLRGSVSDAAAAAAASATNPPYGSPSSPWQPLRITVSPSGLAEQSMYCVTTGQQRPTFTGGVTTCTADDVLTTEKRTLLLDTIIPAAVRLHQERLYVRSIHANIRPGTMVGTVCSQFSIPEEHLLAGVPEADTVVYLAAAPTADPYLIAWALPCQYLVRDNRPLVGVMNVSPRFINDSPETVRAVAHELLHALGFTYDIFLTAGMTSVVFGLRGKSSTTLVTTPTVARVVKEHYSCPTLTGMELEDEGGDGTALSHWERRNAKDELMSGALGVGYYTALTIAVMEDLGYYKGNYARAERMTWGEEAGCTLLSDKCVVNGVSQFPPLFCTDSTTRRCATDRLAVGICSVGISSESLPPYFQYFANPRLTGRTALTDHCPIIQRDNGGRCYDGSLSTVPGSLFSPAARCFDGDGIRVGSSTVTALCVDVKCNHTMQTYTVRVKGAANFTDCPEGNQLRLADYSGEFRTGTMTCAPFYEVCQGNHATRFAVDSVFSAVPMLWTVVVLLVLIYLLVVA